MKGTEFSGVAKFKTRNRTGYKTNSKLAGIFFPFPFSNRK
jgi:hypothetical protein